MTFENDPLHVPSLQEVNEAYSDIVAHNSEHTGISAVMVGVFKHMLETAEPLDADDDGSNPIVRHQNDTTSLPEDIKLAGDMSAELQDIFHSDMFMRVGIKLAPIGGFMRGLEGQDATSRALEPVIDNVVLYKDFLGSLTPEAVTETDSPILSATIATLRTTISISFDPNQKVKIPENMQPAVQEHGTAALRTFAELEPEYERLGLDANGLRARFATEPEGERYLYVSKESSQDVIDSHNAHKRHDAAHRSAELYEDLQNYVAYWGRDLLPEYIVADNNQYLAAPEKQGFGPAEWHIDGGQHRWAKAIAFVHSLEQEDRTRSFADEVRNGLVRSIDSAVGPSPRGKLEYADGQREDLRNIRAALTGQEYDAAKVFEYTKKPNYLAE